MRILKIGNGMIVALLASTSLIQCGKSNTAQSKTMDAMECVYVRGLIDFHRCENEEVICYQGETGLSCKWKKDVGSSR